MNTSTESPREIRVITPEIEQRNLLPDMWPVNPPPLPAQETPPSPPPTEK